MSPRWEGHAVRHVAMRLCAPLDLLWARRDRYLNDVPEGGATRFTSLPSGPVTFQPKRGKAVLWPSVLAEAPFTKDERTDHEALPVTRGEKYGGTGVACLPIGYAYACALLIATLTLAPRRLSCCRGCRSLPLATRSANFWIHQYDFKTAHAKGCTAD